MTTADTSATTRRRLTRSREGRVIAGVCEGAARYFDIDPVIFRIVLAALSVFGGAGILIYVLAWILIPEEHSPETRFERWLTAGRWDLRQIGLFTLLAICVVVLLANINLFAHDFGAAAVAVLAALLLTEAVGRRSGHGLFQLRRPAPPVMHGPPPAPEAATVPDPATITTPLPAAAPRPTQRAWLGWLTFGTLLVTGGVLWLIATSGVAHPQPADALAVCVAIAGIGLLVGAIAGRARAMIPIGLLLVVCFAAADALPRNLTWSAGTRDWTPVASDLAPSYVLGAGQAYLDLRDLDRSTTATIDARVGAGLLMVHVPRGMGLLIDASVSAGRIYVLGHEADGTGVKVHRVIPPASAQAGTLTLHLQGGFGNVEVKNASA